jgi:uncharacterized protein
MIVPDTNLLLFAYDESFPAHAAARSWWETVMNGTEPIGLPWVVILAFVRLATHPTVAVNPRSVPEVRKIVESWVAAPHVRVLHGTGHTMNAFFDALEGANLGGNLCTDALIAALALESGARVFTNDRDFQRFAGLVAVNPLDGNSR